MRRITLPVAGLLAVGLLVGGYVVERASGQVSTGSHSNSTWPPLPQDMIDRQGQVTLSPLTYQTLFDVPSDRWFILTDISLPVFTIFGTPGRVGEDIGGTFTTRFDSGQWGRFQSAVGFAFRPGSRLKLFNPDTSNQMNGSFSIVGYLVPK